MLFHTMGFTGKNPLASWRMGETECCIAAMCALTKNVPTIRLPLRHTKQQGHMKPSDKISTQLPPRVADGFMARVDEVEKRACRKFFVVNVLLTTTVEIPLPM